MEGRKLTKTSGPSITIKIDDLGDQAGRDRKVAVGNSAKHRKTES